jgi:hypothetical protein
MRARSAEKTVAALLTGGKPPLLRPQAGTRFHTQETWSCCGCLLNGTRNKTSAATAN